MEENEKSIQDGFNVFSDKIDSIKSFQHNSFNPCNSFCKSRTHFSFKNVLSEGACRPPDCPNSNNSRNLEEKEKKMQEQACRLEEQLIRYEKITEEQLKELSLKLRQYYDYWEGFEIVEKLGEGGFGRVYRVYDKRNKQY